MSEPLFNGGRTAASFPMLMRIIDNPTAYSELTVMIAKEVIELRKRVYYLENLPKEGQP